MSELPPLRILLAEPERFSKSVIEELSLIAIVDQRACTTDELAAAFKEYDAIWFRLAHRIGPEMLEDGVRCRVLATPVTGLDHIDLDACAKAGVQVISLKGETTFLRSIRSTAELALALTLTLLRRIPEAGASVESGIWNRDLFQGNELSGKTVGIVGVGRLGTIAADMFRAFNTNVIGFDPRPDYPSEVAERVSSLAVLLARSDVVSLHVELNASTRHMIDVTALAAMKPGAVLINTSRGDLIDEGALIVALDSGRLSGAGLDVVSGEPHPPDDHPVFVYAREHPNLVVVPHIGGNTVEAWRATEEFLARKVISALAVASSS